MKKLLTIAAITLLLIPTLVSCFEDNSHLWGQYEELYLNNYNWLNEQIAKKDTNGEPYYTKIVADWDTAAKVYMHYFNDTTLNRDKNRPYYTSTVEVKYRGELYNGTVFDSTAVDSTYTTKLSSVITGWNVALSQMREGDSVQVIIPYSSAYGESGSSSIPPYSNLLFNIKLVSIPALVIP